MAIRAIPKITAEIGNRFWSRVERRDSGCWEWQGCLIGGYGVFSIGKNILAHRAAYAIYYGTDPGEMCVMHSCDNRMCVNPLHLSLGTYLDNNRDRVNKGRQADQRGENGGGAKLKNVDVLEIRRRAANGETRMELASEFGVHHSAITYAVQRKTWKHVE